MRFTAAAYFLASVAHVQGFTGMDQGFDDLQQEIADLAINGTFVPTESPAPSPSPSLFPTGSSMPSISELPSLMPSGEPSRTINPTDTPSSPPTLTQSPTITVPDEPVDGSVSGSSGSTNSSPVAPGNSERDTTGEGETSDRDVVFTPPPSVASSSLPSEIPSDSPSSLPSEFPTVAPVPCPSAPAGGCSICGEGMCISNPGANFTYPGHTSSSICALYEVAGFLGVLNGQCNVLPSIVADSPCGCSTEYTPYDNPLAGSSNGSVEGSSGLTMPDPGSELDSIAALFSELPSEAPSNSPSVSPSAGPSASPSVSPSGGPSASPSASPSMSGKPSLNPTAVPSLSPSEFPTESPKPSSLPSQIPSDQPSSLPSLLPSVTPTVLSSDIPSVSPTVNAVPCPPVPDGGCSICGEGLCIANPDAEFMYPGQTTSSSCSLYEVAGFIGILNSQCTTLPSIIAASPCGCSTTFTPYDDPLEGDRSVSGSSGSTMITDSLPESLFAPTAAPSGSYLPSEVPSDRPSVLPTASPTGSLLPSLEPSAGPSPAPSPTPSENPTSTPTPKPTPLSTTNPTPFPTPVSTTNPTPFPTEVAAIPDPEPIPPTGAPVISITPSPVTAAPVTSAPTAAPVTGALVVSVTPSPVTGAPVTSAPSAAPVTSAPVTSAPVTGAPVAPTQEGNQSVSATISLPAASTMSGTDIMVFEAVTVDFINSNLPVASDRVMQVLSVTVQDQELVSSRRRFLRVLQDDASETKLQVKTTISAYIDSTTTYTLPQIVVDAFDENDEIYLDQLSAASSFFAAEFEAQRTDIPAGASRGVPLASGGSSGDRNLPWIIAGSFVCVVIALFSSIAYIRYFRPVEDDDQPQLDLLSWSTTSDNSVNQKNRAGPFAALDEPRSPTESEIYNASVCSRSGLSPIHESRFSEFDAATPRQAKLEDCNLGTPKHDFCDSQATPKGTPFVQLSLADNLTSLKNHFLSSNKERDQEVEKIRKEPPYSPVNEPKDPLDGLRSPEDEVDILGQLVEMEHKAAASPRGAPTPRQNNLQKYRQPARKSPPPKHVFQQPNNIMCGSAEWMESS